MIHSGRGNRAPQVDYKGFDRKDSYMADRFDLIDGDMKIGVEHGARKVPSIGRKRKSSPHLDGAQAAVDWADSYRKDARKSSDSSEERRMEDELDKVPDAVQGTVRALSGHCAMCARFA